MDELSRHAPRHPIGGRTVWVLAGFLGVAAFFLVTEHRAHLFGALPYLLLLACPLMHLFHRHGDHRHMPSLKEPGSTNAPAGGSP